jgi:NAD(P)-dependent dehydrogenase (short-subunit alcohol dehydrogenase family)
MPHPLNEQVVVITGASSGIGRATAIQFGSEGASVVLAARNDHALNEAATEVELAGGKALPVVTDVADWEQVQQLAQTAVDEFGRIDTWVNNAGIAEYATVDEMTIEEIQRIIDVNLMGTIHGIKAVLTHMKQQNSGTIINVASALAKRSVALQSAYCASKHGVKGFTEALRLELEAEDIPIDVVLIMPSSINTPLFEHARSKMGVQPMPIPPVYEPSAVADTILYVAENPQRDVVVGGAGKFFTLMERISPGLVDWYLLRNDRVFESQKTDRPADGEDNLFEPMDGPGRVTGKFGENANSYSLYTKYLEHHPGRQRTLLAALIALFVGLVAKSSES